MRFSDRRGFTLVELLVVIGIITILIGILLPSLSMARKQSLLTKCAANLHTLGHVMEQYANDNNGWVPRDYTPGVPTYAKGHICWAEAFASYVDLDLPDNPPLPDDASRDARLGQVFLKAKVYHCPAFPRDGHELDYCSNSWTDDSDDGISLPNGGSVTGVPQGMTKINEITRSAQVSFLCEAASRLPNDSFSENDIRDKTSLAYDPTNAADPYNKATCRMLNDERHGGRMNILYFDGHVDAKPWKAVTRDDFRLVDE
jgi:prepilin-type processing-associated H-X9-DG protein/prepilin-type N-terminal cleavage/methylation domain-containing protein